MLWARAPASEPLSVGVVLLHLVPDDRHQFDLLPDNPRRQRLSALVDGLSRRYGRHAVGFGLVSPQVRAFAGHTAFQRVPETWEF